MKSIVYSLDILVRLIWQVNFWRLRILWFYSKNPKLIFWTHFCSKSCRQPPSDDENDDVMFHKRDFRRGFPQTLRTYMENPISLKKLTGKTRNLVMDRKEDAFVSYNLTDRNPKLAVEPYLFISCFFLILKFCYILAMSYFYNSLD